MPALGRKIITKGKIQNILCILASYITSDAFTFLVKLVKSSKVGDTRSYSEKRRQESGPVRRSSRSSSCLCFLCKKNLELCLRDTLRTENFSSSAQN